MKNKAPKKSYVRLRIILCAAMFFVFFAAIFAKAVKLQVVEAERFRKLAERQHTKTVSIQPRRGEIYDRNSRELAVSLEVDSVYANPDKVRNPRKAAGLLSPVLSVERAELEKRLGSRAGFVWLKRQVDLSDVQRKALDGIVGIGLTRESRRYYPNAYLAANIIGFTGVDANGLEGVELRYDGMLRGASVSRVGEKDAKGRVLLYEDMDKTHQASGQVVELTIDKSIQFIAEKALKKAVEGARAKGGMAVVMEPSTGEVLAMAALPSFDPNDIKKFNPKEWRNKAVVDAFEPGSTLKLFLVAGALEENVVKPNDLFFCENGSYRVADRVFHDTEKHGYLTVSDVIKHSSNICAAKIGARLGKNGLYKYMNSFGFGEKTGIDLPGETAGVLKHYKNWSGVSMETISFGHGVAVSGLQLANAVSAIANGGFLMKPHIVRSVRDKDGKAATETAPSVVRRVISDETAGKLTKMLVSVTESDGTGTKAAIKGFDVAGKTGTAQKPDLKNGGYEKGAYMASFVGFLPAKNPRLVILVVVDEPQGDYYGGAVAAPAFKEIAEESLAYLGVFSETSGKAAPLLGRASVEGVSANVTSGVDKTVSAQLQGDGMEHVGALSNGKVPDFTGKTMRAVLRMAKAASLDVDVVGSGAAVSQRPGPGMSAGSKVIVRFE
ncbi:MAG: penicillin-binding protein [Deltaproteobacteria bacterium]|jgi:cell division protein FtsI (penicillin-binding protein 3)